MTSQKLVRDAVKIAESKKAKDILLLNLKEISTIADYFIICSGESSLHMRSIAQAIEKELKKKGIKQFNPRNLTNDCWVLLDFGSIIVHIFSKRGRNFYQLERLWADAKKITK